MIFEHRRSKGRLRMEIGLALLRLTTGLILAAHGAQKLFGWFDGPGLDGTGQFFETIGFQPGRRHALKAGLAETGGGLLLALGLFTPIGTALICSVMLVAGTVHAKNGFFVQNGGYEHPVVLGVAALSIAFTGPGAFSLDALFGNHLSGTLWGIAALFVGVLGGAFSLIQRHATPAQQTEIVH
jgi:putative oxidoreductase